jgi:hypothetical protein
MGYSTDEKAEAIVTSALHTDAEAAKICDVSARSIKRWRSQMDERPELARAVTLKWNRAREESNWAESATHAIQKGLSFLREATERLNPGDPEHVQVVIEAIQVLARAKTVHDVIEQRLAQRRQRDRPDREDDGSIAGRIGDGRQ